MAEIPGYESRIAPPSSTGEVLDNFSVGLALATGRAKANATSAASSAFGAVGNIAQEVGQIYTRTAALGQQAQMLEDLQTLSGDITGQESNLSQNRNLLKDWSYGESGEPSEHMNSWTDARLNELGQGLEGKWREAFELEASKMMAKAGYKFNAMATEHSYGQIQSANAASAQAALDNPDTNNVRGSYAEGVKNFTDRYDLGVNSGIYKPEMRDAAIAEYSNKLLGAHFMAVARDIQDGTAWTSPDTGEVYEGLDGADQAIQDYKEAGIITDAQAAGMIESIYEEDTHKYARGAQIQADMSNETWNSVMKDIADISTPMPTVADILGLAAVTPERTQTYNRHGDRGLANSLLAAREDALTPPKTEDEDVDQLSLWRDDEVWRRYNDGTWDDPKFRSWLWRNGEDKGYTRDEINSILAKGRDNINQGTSGSIEKYVNDRYAPLLRDAKSDEERDTLLAERNMNSHRLTIAMYDDDITETEDVMNVLDNWSSAKINDEIFKEQIRDDPRRSNPAEQVNLDIMRGGYMGLTGIPEFNEQVLRVKAVHEALTAQEYGAGNILERRSGNIGTPWEGRTVFKVKDPQNGMRETWIKWDSVENERGFLEEVAQQLDGYDPYSGEIWNPATAPALRAEKERVNAIAGAADRAVVSSVTNLALAGQSFQEIVDQTGLTPAEVGNAAGPEILAIIPGSPTEDTSQNRNLNWFKRKVDGSNISRADVDMYIVTNALSIDEIDQFNEDIYETVFPKMSEDLMSDWESGVFTLYNKRTGRLMNSAMSTLGSQIRRYGLPSDYAERVYEEVFTQQQGLNTGGGL